MIKLDKHTQQDNITIVNTSEYAQFIRPPIDSGSIREDFVSTGYVIVNLKSARRAKYVKVMFVCTAQLDFPGRPTEDAVIFENTMWFNGSDTAWIDLDTGSQIFEFAFVLPSTLAGFDRNPYGCISHRILATVVGQDTPSFFLRKGSNDSCRNGRILPSSPPEVSKDLAFFAYPTCNDHLDRMVLSRRNSRGSLPERFSSPKTETSSLFSTSSNEGLPWLIGDLVASKQVWIIPLPTEDRQPPAFNFRTRDHLPGLGHVPWTIESHAITVGGSIFFGCNIADINPKATVWCIRLVVNQKYKLSSPSRSDEEPVTMTASPLLLFEKGKILSNNNMWFESRGTRGHGPLWEGDLVPGPASKKRKEVLEIAEVLKLPDENRMRPSTCEGTITPIRISHEFALQIFFSVWGEDISGQPLPKAGPGQVRKAVLRTKALICSCGCTRENLGLPTYDRPRPSNKPMENIHEQCACRQPIEDLSSWTNSRGRKEEETDFSLDQKVGGYFPTPPH